LTEEEKGPREIDRDSDDVSEEGTEVGEVVDDRSASGETRGDVVTREVLAAYMEEYSGPIPHPVTLRQINEVVPGAAKQIIDDAHAQTAHRQKLETKYLDAAIANSKRGQVFAFIVAAIVLVGSMVLIGLGAQLIGFAMVIASLAALVGVFVYTRKGQAQQLGDARQAFPPNPAGGSIDRQEEPR
jgi:uncharacterized membrane protein